ncbi:MAG: aminotransferase class V-fold PLP-dependent enzyme [Acidobacteria bacterium]|nr:aminotransferase class V-fold PLP-dependent enzyme [Acidobacteriota bacterium]
MFTTSRLLILKFGSSVLRSETDLPQVVQEIYHVWRGGNKVLVVVSAFGNTTDTLLQRAYNLCKEPEPIALANLLATGETTASILLGLALNKAGIATKTLDATQAGLVTTENPLDSELISANTEYIQKELENFVVVIPGFIGKDSRGNTTLLGRGGSDFTAIFLSQQLKGHCILVKDVDGLYTSDPALVESQALRFSKVKWETACEIGGKVVQSKAVQFAASQGLSFTIKSINSNEGTEVGLGPDQFFPLKPLTLSKENKHIKIPTCCVHINLENTSYNDLYNPSVPPIYQTATFRQTSATKFGAYDYSRTANPTRTLLEEQLAQLEGGSYASAFSSGMAALTALTRLVKPGEEIIASNDLYGGTVRLLNQLLTHYAIGIHYVDTSNIAEIAKALNPKTKLIIVETPTNPFLRICDIRAIAQLAKNAGVLLAVDNSMLSPCFQQPLRLGADIVVHSATKFLGGHGDLIAGAVITSNAELNRKIAFQQNAEGSGLSPFESWLLMRGIKTLALRAEKQNISARKVAEYLNNHPLVKKVYYPGLSTHSGYDIHRQQATGDGAVISFTSNNKDFSERIVQQTKLFSTAVSFGSVYSTISLPYNMSHLSIPLELKNQLAPPSDLVRISVGIEDVEDLMEDLDEAIRLALEEDATPLLAL